MNYPKIEVDGGGYTAACDWLYDGNHAIFEALNTLSNALADSYGMAGGDQSGIQWAGDYDKAAGKLVDAASQLCDAFGKAANLTNTSLSNHDAADGGSIYGNYPGEPSMPPEDKDPDHDVEGIYFGVPSAKGSTGGEPGWWHWLASHMEGWFWPNADTGKLRTIGAAWRTAGQAIQRSDTYATIAASELEVEKSPEITVATKALNGLGKHCDTIGGAFVDLGKACEDYAKMVDDKHREIEDELQSFLEWTAGIEVVGGIVSVFTAGIAEAPTQAVEGAEVANAASKVIRLLSALLDAVKGSEVVAGVITRIEKVVPALGRFLKADKDVADVEKAAVEVESRAAEDAGWNNPNTLADHFNRHGADVGAASEEQYAKMANDFLARAKREGLPTKVTPDGTIRVYDPATNTFGSYTADGLTKTFFKPSSPTYWDRQPGVPQ